MGLTAYLLVALFVIDQLALGRSLIRPFSQFFYIHRFLEALNAIFGLQEFLALIVLDFVTIFPESSIFLEYLTK